MPLPGDFDEEAVIRACDAHEQRNRGSNDYRRCLAFPGFFVKFDCFPSLFPQFKTQEYLSEIAKADGRAPRVPEVYHFFYRDGGMAYVVMEYIDLINVSPEALVPKAAQAIRWMRDVPAPGVVLGPLGSGRVRHPIFKNYRAPLAFTSVQALELFFNKAVTKVRPQIPDVRIAEEPLVLTQSDMDATNFGVDAEGRSCIFDFDEIGWLPKSLADYNLFSTTFAIAVAKELGMQRSPNLAWITLVKGCLWMASPTNLGLDNDGNPTKPG